MTQYSSLNVRLSNSQFNKLKYAIKNETDEILRLLSNMIGNSDDEVSFPHRLFLTNRQVANFHKAFANHTSTDIKLSKTQLTKMQKGGLLRLLAPLLNSRLPLLKSVINPLGMLGLYSRDNLTDEIKDGANVINLDKYSDIGTHWIALYVNNKTATYFDGFGIEEVKKFIGNKNIITNIYRVQNYDSIMCGFFVLVLSI